MNLKKEITYDLVSIRVLDTMRVHDFRQVPEELSCAAMCKALVTVLLCTISRHAPWSVYYIYSRSKEAQHLRGLPQVNA